MKSSNAHFGLRTDLPDISQIKVYKGSGYIYFQMLLNMRYICFQCKAGQAWCNWEEGEVCATEFPFACTVSIFLLG